MKKKGQGEGWKRYLPKSKYLSGLISHTLQDIKQAIPKVETSSISPQVKLKG